MSDCKNPTCDRRAARTYCSRECQLATRTANGGKQLPDIWVTMAMWHRLHDRAEALNLSMRDLVMNALEAEVGIDA